VLYEMMLSGITLLLVAVTHHISDQSVMHFGCLDYCRHAELPV